MNWKDAANALPKTQASVIALGIISAIILSLGVLLKFLFSRTRELKQDRDDLHDQMEADVRRHKDGKENAVVRWANKHRFKPKRKSRLP